MKKGFTLIELLAVIIILAVVAVIATPMILNVVDDAKNSARDSKLKLYADNVKLKAEGSYFTNNGKIDGEIDVSTINNNSTTCAKAYYINGGVYLGNCTIDGVNGLYYVNGIIETTSTNYDNAIAGVKPLYKDASGANIPELLDKMVAVKYDGTNWIVADLYNNWYDYDAKKWANAVILNNGVTKSVGDTINVDTEVSQMYVWIPRYKYTIFNGNNDAAPVQEINAAFESGTASTGTVTCIDNIGTQSTSEDCNDNGNAIINGTSTYTHPAFTFGDKSLTGIWVGKFEIGSNIMNTCTPTNDSVGTECDTITGNIQIKPNVTSWRGARISTYYNKIKNISDDYELTNADSHMMRNMEWGAIAYLTQSKYGRCTSESCTEVSINNSTNYYTGRSAGAPGSAETITSEEGTYTYEVVEGQLASTTGNIYGIYDINGGTWEATMGNLAKSNTMPVVGGSDISSSGFIGKYHDGTDSGESIVVIYPTGNDMKKYADLYSYDSSTWSTQSRGKLGDATKETLLTYGDNYNGGWYGDSSIFPYTNVAWFSRGGDCLASGTSGIFSFHYFGSGNAFHNGTTRSILSAK